VASSRRLSLFAVTRPGLEDLTRAELFSLGINHPRAVPVSPLPTPNTPAMFNDQKMIQAA
jgi:hypothetical protein